MTNDDIAMWRRLHTRLYKITTSGIREYVDIVKRLGLPIEARFGLEEYITSEFGSIDKFERFHLDSINTSVDSDAVQTLQSTADSERRIDIMANKIREEFLKSHIGVAAYEQLIVASREMAIELYKTATMEIPYQ